MISSTFYLTNEQAARQAVQYISQHWKAAADIGQPIRCDMKVQAFTRTNEQNKKLWAMLGDVARQVDWYGHRLTPENWKDVFTAALKRQQVVPGLDGGFVALGSRTSNMTIGQMSEMIELMLAFGAQRSVEWSNEDNLIADAAEAIDARK